LCVQKLPHGNQYRERNAWTLLIHEMTTRFLIQHPARQDALRVVGQNDHRTIRGKVPIDPDFLAVERMVAIPHA